ncbi:MAG: C39 family peptidase [bacterium]|nr:C39 family peptidase [bacterium]
MNNYVIIEKVGITIMVLLGSLTIGITNLESKPLLVPQVDLILYQTKSDFEYCHLYNIVYNDLAAGFELAKTTTGKFMSSGMIVSPSIKTKFLATTLVTSWNALLPKGTAVKIEIQVKSNYFSRWSPWYEIATYGDKQLDNPEKIKRGLWGYVKEDELKLRVGSRYFRFRITLMTIDSSTSPILNLFGVSYADMKHRIELVDRLLPFSDTQTSESISPDWAKDLPVPYRSQLYEDKTISWRACHPTSLAMILEYYGTNLPTAEVARCVWDDYNGIYGNWSYNAAFAGTLGYRAWVRYCNGFDEIKKEIAAGHPVILSIAYPKGVLSNAPVKSTNGHIIVCRGFTPQGDPICNDPAAKSEETGHIVYKKEELERAWLTRKAAAIFIHPAIERMNATKN